MLKPSTDGLTKRCPSCGETKPREGFYREARRKDGLAGYCKACSNRKGNEWAKRNPQKSKAWVKAGQANITPEQHRARNLRVRFGLSLEDYGQMLERQGGGCAACGRLPGDRPLHVDHDHSCCDTNKTCGNCVRGLLCFNCNGALGHLADSEERLLALLDYLRRAKC